MSEEVKTEGALAKLAKKINKPEFIKAFRRNKVKAVEEAMERPLSKDEKSSIKAMTHTQLKGVVKAVNPRGGGPYIPE
jgi:hypothetical protein